MATHDYVISNASGASVRADLNNALAAIVSNNSNATSPATTYAYQWWADTTTGQLKLRNSANSAWITIFELDGTMLMEDGTVSAPGLAFASDLDTGFFRSAADKINFATGGAERLEIGSSEVVFNDPSNDVDFRVESNGNTHMLFVDAGNDRVGVGVSAPTSPFDVAVGGAGPARLIASQVSDNPHLDFYRSTGSGSNFSGLRISNPDVAGALALSTAGGANIGSHTFNERARIDPNGRLLVGATSSRAQAGINFPVFVEGTGFTGLGAVYNANNTTGAFLALSKTRGTSVGSNTIVQDGDQIGEIFFSAADGTDLEHRAATIQGMVDGTPGSNVMPGRLVFSTTADGASSPTERLRIDSSGNVGVGTTSPTDTGGYGRALDIQSNTGAAIYLRTNDDTSQIAQGSSDLTIRTRQAHPIVFNTNNSEVARIDSDGRLSVGTSTAPTIGSTQFKVNVSGESFADSGVTQSRFQGSAAGATHIIAKARGTAASPSIVQDDDELGKIRFYGYDGSDFSAHGAEIKAEVDGTPGANDMPGRLVFSTTADGASSPTERMRIKADGSTQFTTNSSSDVTINQTSTSAGTIGLLIQAGTTNTSDTTTHMIRFRRNDGTEIGKVRRGGFSSVAYDTTSDYRLKSNVVPLTDAVNRVKSFNPVRFNWLEDTSDNPTVVDGFLAHEAQTVVPEAVSGYKDEVDDEGNAVIQGIDQAKLVPLLTAALQEAIAKIETLETKVAALEAG